MLISIEIYYTNFHGLHTKTELLKGQPINLSITMDIVWDLENQNLI